jgi:hypothetical protein
MTTSGINHSSSPAIFNRNEGHNFADFLSHVETIDAFALTPNEWAGFNGATTAQNIGGVGPDEFKYATGRGHNQHTQRNVQRHANTPRVGVGSELEHATRTLMSLTLPVTVEQGGHQQTPTSLTFSSPATPIIPAYPAVANARAWRPYESSSTTQIDIDPSLIDQGRSSNSLKSISLSSSHPVPVTKSPTNGTNGSSTRKRPAPTPLTGSAHPNKRPRSQSQSQPSPPTNGNSTTSSKPPLLTPAQKKANHIASEQKRRAKIRRGYDALCDVVPSLKAAITVEQEAAASGSGGWNHATGEAKRGRKTRSGKGVADEVPPPMKDGSRAGPKSESIVLSQSAYAFSESYSQ